MNICTYGSSTCWWDWINACFHCFHFKMATNYWCHKKSSTIRHVLQGIFSRNRAVKILAFNTLQNFMIIIYNKATVNYLHLLENHLQSNKTAEWMMQTNEAKNSLPHRKILSHFHLIYNSLYIIYHADELKCLSALMEVEVSNLCTLDHVLLHGWTNGAWKRFSIRNCKFCYASWKHSSHFKEGTCSFPLCKSNLTLGWTTRNKENDEDKGTTSGALGSYYHDNNNHQEDIFNLALMLVIIITNKYSI